MVEVEVAEGNLFGEKIFSLWTEQKFVGIYRKLIPSKSPKGWELICDR